jgi:hypothetical protein
MTALALNLLCGLLTASAPTSPPETLSMVTK